jgi:hypothetical protein
MPATGKSGFSLVAWFPGLLVSAAKIDCILKKNNLFFIVYQRQFFISKVRAIIHFLKRLAHNRK